MSIRYVYPEKDLFWEKSFQEQTSIFDDDTLANDWLKGLIEEMSLQLLRSQESWGYAFGELGHGINPKLVGDEARSSRNKTDAITAINDAFDSAIAWLKDSVCVCMLRRYLHDDIDMSDEAIEMLFDAGYEDELRDFHQLIPAWDKN